MSPEVFNMVLPDVLQEVESVWKRSGYGTNIGQQLNGKRLTLIAFSDDMTLFARTWLAFKRMVVSLRASLAKNCLQLHPSKCQVQTNKAAHVERGHPLKMLGTMLSLTDVTDPRDNSSSRCRLAEFLVSETISSQRESFPKPQAPAFRRDCWFVCALVCRVLDDSS